jgi:hypothetical protein
MVGVDAMLEKRSAEALRGYVTGDLAEPSVISAFHDVPASERNVLVTRHRPELAAIDPSRLLILESMLLRLDERRG